jgi:hypothetical protein
VRTYGRTRDTLTGVKTWQVITTDANGFNDMVWLTTLAQCCKLNLGESPFWADWGIPAQASVMTQTQPNYYMALMQQRFAPYFMSLLLSKFPDAFDSTGRPMPYYAITVITNWGAYLERVVPV